MIGQELFGMGIVLGFRNQAKTGMDMARQDYEHLRFAASKADAETKACMDHMSQNWRRAKYNFALSGVAFSGLELLSSLDKESEQATADLRSLGVRGAKAYIQGASDLIAKQNLPIDYGQGLRELYNEFSGGIKESDLVSVLKGTGITALATMGSIEESVRAFVTDYNVGLRNMTGTTEERVNRWSDIVAASVQKYFTKLPELAKQHEKVAADAALMGYGLEQTYTAIGALMSGGVKEDAGTSLRAALSKINQASKITGLEFVDAQKKAKPLLEIIDLLIGKYGRSPGVDKLDELTTAFDREGKKAIATLMLQRDAYAEGLEKARQMGFAQNMASDRTDTLNYKIIGLKNSWSKLKDTIGEGSDAARDLAESTTSALNAIDDFLKKHPKVTETGFDYLKMLIPAGIIAGLGFGKSALKWGMSKVPLGNKAFGWLGPTTELFGAYKFTKWLQEYTGNAGPSVATPSSYQDFWDSVKPLKGYEEISPNLPNHLKIFNPFSKDNISSFAENYYPSSVDEPTIEMRNGKLYKPVQSAETQVQTEKSNTDKAPKQITNSFNVTLNFPNATSPEQVKAEIEKFMRDRNEKMKRWFSLRRGEEPHQYEN